MDSLLPATMSSKVSRQSISLSLDWDNLFKRTPDSKKDLLAAITLHDRATTEFCTGSSYSGKWNQLGMADNCGSYTFVHGCEYVGGMEDGQFHGKGTLVYPMGQKLDCTWYKGKLVSYKFSDTDGLSMTDDFVYCKQPDRRFLVSIQEGLEPAGRERLTNRQPTRVIGPQYYDTIDGSFDPATNTIIPARDESSRESIDFPDEETETETKLLWVTAATTVSQKKADWIKKHCRKGWDEASGYRHKYYEHWTTGRKKELEEIEAYYNTRKESTNTETVEKEIKVTEPEIPMPQESIPPKQLFRNNTSEDLSMDTLLSIRLL